MNPFDCLSEDVWPLVLNHLTVRDILNLSLVSPTSEEIIGESFVCMKKIWLRLYPPLNDVGSLLSSKRKYQNVKIQRGLPTKCKAIFKMYRWRQVMMRDDLEMDCAELLGQIATTVEHLEIWDVAVTGPIAPVDFPCLQSLTYNLSTPETFSIFFGKNPRLKEMKLTASSMLFTDAIEKFTNSESFMDQFFESNSQIENLQLNSVNRIFKKESSIGSLKLRKLSIEIDFEDDEKENFMKFVRSQKHLEDISIHSINDFPIFVDLMISASKCRALRFLKSPRDENDRNLPTLAAIVEIEIPQVIGFKETLLRCFTSLEVLILMGPLSLETLSFIAHNLFSLRILRAKKISTETYEEYKRLKSKYCEINRDIHLESQ